jgi:hypothetical protein
MSALITIQFCVPLGYQSGDYAILHGNGGAGAIDWVTPLLNTKFELFPNGAGIYGFGYAPFGQFPFGYAFSMRAPGFGYLPFGYFPFGYGTALIKAAVRVEQCGEYKFGFACYDKLGNLHTGTPEEVTVNVHVAPPVPGRLTKYSYNKTTDVLVLNAA